jgi:DUF4097 and DUF4098 domain-containing protein YvlB
MPEFPCPAPITASVHVAAGGVDITAEPRDTAAVSVTPWDGSDASRDTAARTTAELIGDRLVIQTPEASGWLLRRHARVRVDVRVPLDSTLEVKVASADVRCRGRFAGARVKSASGDVAVEHVTGDAAVKTASGHVLVDRVDGNTSADAASGDITVTLAGGDVTAHVTSGDLTIDEAGGSVQASSASGTISVGCARRGALKLKTASGGLNVGVAQGTSVWLDAITVSGRTLSDLDMSGGPAAGGRPDLALTLRTASGDIDIHRVVARAAAA